MDRGRPSGGFGPARLTYPDIFAWSMLSGNDPSPMETKLLMAIDSSYLAEVIRLAPKK